MPIIINSKNIYEKEQSIIKKNNVGSIEQNVENFTKKYGNVSNSEFVFNFYGYNEETGKYEPLYEVDESGNAKVSGVEFIITEDEKGIYASTYTAKLEIDKITAILPYENVAWFNTTSHKIRNYYKKVNTSMRDIFPDLVNIEAEETIENPFITNIFTDENDRLWIQFKLDFLICKNPQVEGATIYTTSVSTSILGDYYEENSITKKIGDAKGNVLSLDTNEIIQNGNYITNGTSDYQTDILQPYLISWENGKETAFLRCAVGDYGYIDSESKQPIKRTFRINDEVVPYSFNAEGQEEPLSQDANGHAKIFVVLGVDFVYDGALWQELHLQETGAVYKPTIIALSAPIVTLYDDILQINDTNARIAQFFEIFVDDALAMKIPASGSGSTYFSMKALGLSAGSYTINVCATAKKYKKSPKSGDETYIVGEIKKLSAPTIAIDGDTLTITDESGLAEEFEILADGSVVGSVSAKNSN